MTKALALGLMPELLVFLERLSIQLGVVLKGDAVESKIGTELAFFRPAIEMTALDVIERGRAERQRRLRRIAAAADNVNVGRVVGPRRRGHGTGVEEASLNRQQL